MDSSHDWQGIVRAKRLQNAEKIPLDWRLPAEILRMPDQPDAGDVTNVPQICGILSTREVDLTENYDATRLLAMLARGDVSSYDLTLAFCKRASIAHQLVNCLSEIFFDEALRDANAADEHLSRTGLPIGRLHGLPISLKDYINVKGQHSTIGLVAFVNRAPASTDSTTVKTLRQQGAILFVKTNVSQGLMTSDSDNNVFGRTVNPQNRRLTAGGSSGGEAALLRLSGSPLGIASDIAGSSRVPALVNGIFGFKPTAGRLANAGNLEPGRAGSPSQICPTVGLMGHSVRDMELGMRAIIESQPWHLDAEALDIAWRSVQPCRRSLRLGMILEHPRKPLHPPILRTFKSAIERLKTAGHIIVDINEKIPDLWEVRQLLCQYFALDPERTLTRILNDTGEPCVPSVESSAFPGLETFQADLNTLYDMNLQRSDIVSAYCNIFVDNTLDAIVMPVHQTTAVSHDKIGFSIYCSLANLLNVPAGVVPFLKANQKLDAEFIRANVTYEPRYMPEEVEGASSGIQIVGRRLRDEELLAIMGAIDLDLNR